VFWEALPAGLGRSFAARPVTAVDLRPVVTHHFSVFRPSNNGGCAYAGQLTAIVHLRRLSPVGDGRPQ